MVRVHIGELLLAVVAGSEFTVIVRVAVATAQAPVTLLVKVRITVPLLFADGVKVTAAGLAVIAVLLSVPVPLVMDHAPCVAAPPTLAPAKVIAAGDED